MQGVIEDCGESRSSCGYCGATRGFYSHGMKATSLAVQAYQDLLDIGWRRSGTYLYKPDLTRMCCPLYTIRLPVEKFAPSRSQTKTLRRFQRYLQGGALHPELKKRTSQSPRKQLANNNETTVTGINLLFKLLLEEMLQQFLQTENLVKVEVEVTVENPSSKKKSRLSGNTFLSSPICITLYHKISLSEVKSIWASSNELALVFCNLFDTTQNEFLDKLNLSTSDHEKVKSFLKNISVYSKNGHLNFCQENEGSLTEADISKILRVPTSSVKKDADVENRDHEVFRKCSSQPEEQFCNELKQNRNFQISIIPSKFLEEEYLLYKKYQMTVHGDSQYDCSKGQYTRFLIETPLRRQEAKPGQVPDPGFGSFHMQYRIDGKLVAVGVVDILPRCLSSKYFFWDPSFAPLSLGRLSSLKEIEWLQQASIPGLEYYYMGYYAHSCPKMKYKTEYQPSQLLCPESCLWVTYNKTVEKKLDEEKYYPLSRISGVELEENLISSPNSRWHAEIPDEDLSAQPIQDSGVTITFGEYKNRLFRAVTQFNRNANSVRQIEDFLKLFTMSLKKWKRVIGEIGDQLTFQVPYV